MADATDPVWIEVLPSMRNFGSEMAKGAGGAAEKVGTEVGKKFGAAMLAGLAVVAGGASLAGAALYKIGATFDEMADTIRVGTGATGKDLETLISSAKKVGKDVPASFGDVGTTVADVNTRLGLTGTNLETVSKQVLEAGRLLGTKVDIASVSASFKAFNLSADQVSGGMDTLWRVSQATGVGINELAKGVRTSAPALQTLGFSFETSVAMMGAFDKAGLNVNQIAASMTRSLTNMAKNGEQPQEAFKRIVKEIGGFIEKGDEAGALNVAGKVFGTRGAAQFVQAIRNGSLNMQALNEIAVSTGDTILGAGKETADFSESWDLFKNRVLVVVEPLATRLFNTLAAGMTWIANNAVPALEGFAAGWTNFTGAGGQVRIIAEQIFSVLRSGMDWITGTAIPAVQAFIRGWQDYSGAGGETRRVVEGVISVVKNVAGTLWENRDAILVVAGVITALLIPGWIMLGVQATISAVKQGAAWVATQGKAVASAFAQSGAAVRIVAGWVMQSAAAIKSGAETAAIWLMLQWDAIKSAAAQVAAHARTAAAWAASKLRAVADAAVIVGQWILMGAQATQSAAIQVAAGARTAAIWVGQRLAMLGHLAVMGLVRGATIAWTATQWLLNAALNANPIGLIVIGLMLLVGAIVYAWNNSETFRRIVMAAWDGIKAAASATVNWFVNTALPFLQGLWNNVVAGFVWLKDTVIGSIMALVNSVVDRFTWWRDTLTLIAILATLWVQLRIEWLRQMVVGIFEMLVTNVVNRFTWWRDTLTMIAQVASQWVVDKVTWLRNKGLELVRAMVDGIVDRFNWWRDTITSIADTVKNWVLERIEALKANAMNTWQAMVDGIARIWDGLKKAASDPVRFVVDTVINNGIIKGWNDLVGLLKLDGKLKVTPISVPGFAAGGWTGPGAKHAPAGVVHADEFVVRKESRQRIEQSNPGLLDYLNRTGTMPGYAEGGRVHPVPGWPANMGRGYHGSDRGIDIPAPMGTPVVAMRDSTVNSTAKWGYSYGWHVRTSDGAIYAHMSDILVAAGQVLKAGQQLGRVGNTGNSFGPHLHVTTYDGASPVGAAQPGGGSGFDPLAAVMGFVTDKLSTPVKALIDKIPGAGVFVDVAKGLGTRMLDSAIEKIKALGGSAPADADQRPGVLPPGGAVERWRPVVLQALRMMNQPESYADLTLRRLNQESSGNPGIVNNWDINARNGTPSKGLMQVIDPTFRAYAMPGYSSNIFDPLSNILASMRYALARYGSLPRAYNRPGGYWRGTNFASPGVAWVGERGPELIDFRGGERVYDAKESKRFSSTGDQYFFQPEYAEPRDPSRDFEEFMFNVKKAMS